MISRAAIALALMGLATLAGCAKLPGGHAGALRSQSMRTDAVVLPGRYRVAYFWHDNVAGTSIVLSDVPIEQVLKGEVRDGQMLHIELLWEPKAGRTPMDSSATNASIRHIVISGGEVGIYGGAGFAMPGGSPASDDRIAFTLRDASLELQECTRGFVDLLSPAQLTGTFRAQRDDKRARQLYFGMSQLVTNALGRTRYVHRTTPPASMQTAQDLMPVTLTRK